MKNWIFRTLALLFCLSLLPAAARAEETGTCGENLSWALSDGVLTITGSGAMEDYTEISPPWEPYRDSIRKLVLTGGVTTVGSEAFAGYSALTEADLGDSLTQLNYRAFAECSGLTSLTLPKSFTSFEEECLRSCKNLTEIHCEGGFPHFRLNCLWDTHAKIYFPAERPWSVTYIAQLEEAFHGRIEFLASDGSDPYTPEAETTGSTEETVPETTAETVPETTQPPTAETTPETVPETTRELPPATTVPVTTEAAETAPETLPSASAGQEGPGGGEIFTGVLVFLIFTALGVGGLLYASKKKG